MFNGVATWVTFVWLPINKMLHFIQNPLVILALITFPPPKKICKNEGSMRMGYSRTTLMVMQNSFQEKYRFILQRISLWKLNSCFWLEINPWAFSGKFVFDVQSFAGYIPKHLCYSFFDVSMDIPPLSRSLGILVHWGTRYGRSCGLLKWFTFFKAFAQTNHNS